jgi:hypothetical protein
MAERDIPGGERNGERSNIGDPPAGVEGIVSSGVTPKRHRLPTAVEVPHSVPELVEVSSSPEELPKPTSVVSSSSCKADGIKAALAAKSLDSTWPTGMSFWMETTEVAIGRLRV